MNDYGFETQKDYYDRSVEFSRTDLWILSIMLSLFAAVMLAGLAEFSRHGEIVLPVLATIAVTVGAVASFWGAIQWGRPASEEEAAAEVKELSLQERAYDIDLYHHHNSRAA